MVRPLRFQIHTAHQIHRVAVGAVHVKIRIVEIQHPLPHIAGHIVNAVGAYALRKNAHIRSLRDMSVKTQPRHIRRRIAPGVHPPVRPARRLFPLRLRGQPHAGPLAVGVGILPGHPHHRLLRPVAQAVVAVNRRLPSRGLHKRRIQGVRHLIFINMEGVHVDFMLGRLVAADPVVAAHRERPGRHQNHRVRRTGGRRHHRLFHVGSVRSWNATTGKCKMQNAK